MGGLSAIVGAVALVGFVIFLIGVALVVLASSQGRGARSGVLLAVIGLVIGLLFTLVSNGLLFVDVTQVAVITNTLTGTLETPRQPGTSIVIPGLQIATFYPTTQQEFTMGDQREGSQRDDNAVAATTTDGQQVSLDVTVFYYINTQPEELNDFHRTWGGDVVRAQSFIRSTIRTVVRDIVATFRAADIYGVGRVAMQQQITEQLAPDLLEGGFILETVNVRGLHFSEEFVQSIERVAVAEQGVLQAEQEAQAAISRAGGERQSVILRAEGEAESIILRASAEAEALRLVSQQLAANPLLIQYQYIQTLGPNVRLAIIPSNSPFLFDLESIAANPDFIAPEVPQIELIQPTPAPGQ